ncbi:LptA/OstA family protein [Pararhodospirillum oryzae]|uniref:Organic solvent tolerance-like N-terminal domain-containing protein n=1 Tax=Pararhodospirillum oryzae TaxID=478448 RepID=A0A512H7W6_9PROT|nr:LptA/OstA family protein [Pararhodospirillum oryzae]GEO81545.1 hypothetical protein ROR02_16760 [Pararhodospirillum oryzae]
MSTPRRARHTPVAGLAGLAWGLAVALAPAWGQAPQPAEGGDGPLEVQADDGIEWHRAEGLYIARGNASAVQGDRKVFADRLIARYHPGQNDDTSGAQAQEGGEGGGSAIYRMEAVGHARIVMPDQTIHGDHAVRDLERRVIWVTGGPPRLETPTQVVTAQDSLEYWEDRSLAVARGRALARQVESGRTIQADVLTARFPDRSQPQPRPAPAKGRTAKGAAPGAEGSGIQFMTAKGNVEVVTETEVIRGDEATYDPNTGLATLVGNVRITTQGGEQLTGSRANVNMKTGVSRLFSEGGGRARALFNTSGGGTPGGGGPGQSKGGAENKP